MSPEEASTSNKLVEAATQQTDALMPRQVYHTLPGTKNWKVGGGSSNWEVRSAVEKSRFRGYLNSTRIGSDRKGPALHDTSACATRVAN
jgi:hypothetical protein